ncbi:MAG: endonuclease III [Candidatus Bathyarchaeota archaeon]|nr:endonuclease III [Candidatus Bathyarchaeota archaeon]
MSDDRAAKILQILKHNLALPLWIKANHEPFETLVMTIISQNTTDQNTIKAYKKLSKVSQITSKALAETSIDTIENAIKSAGLYKTKAQAIKQAAQTILERYNGALQPVLSLPIDQARDTLMQIKGIGPKTADVVLLFSAKQPTIPVDTHVNRVSKRLGFVPAKADYETVRKNLQLLFNTKDYLVVHLLLIAHGRKICKALNPLCDRCVVNMYCPTKGDSVKL